MRIHQVLLAATLLLSPLHAQERAVQQVAPMAADAHPSFEVATIKLHDPDDFRHDGIDTSGERVMIWNQSVSKMMVFAYGINKHQIADAPDWALNLSFDIQGKADVPGQPSWDQIREMLQKLLASRFSLKSHREQRELPVYALQVVKGGPQLAPAADQRESRRSTRTVMACGASTPTPARALQISSLSSSSGWIGQP